MVHALGAGTSGAIPQAVEDRVDPCPQAVHRCPRTPLEKRGRIVDITGVLAVISAMAALSALPPLPEALRVVRNVGRLGLFAARVDRAVELVFREFALDVLA